MRLSRKAALWAVFVVLSGGLTLAIYGVLIEPDRLVVRDLALPSADWPADAPPLRLAVIADIHAGAPHIDEAKLAQIVAVTNAQRPDLVLLLGDYVVHGVAGGTFITPETTAGYLAGLRAPLGVYAVLGNHDWWLDGSRVRRALAAASITVLENDAARVADGRHDFWIAGLADDTTRVPDGAKALAPIPAGAPVVMIMHDPASIDQVPLGVPLALAGHTHGGQIYLPWLFPPVTPGRSGPDYAYGEITKDGKRLYVSGGIGTSIIPVRLNMPPEIVVISLSGIRDQTSAIRSQ